MFAYLSFCVVCCFPCFFLGGFVCTCIIVCCCNDVVCSYWICDDCKVTAMAGPGDFTPVGRFAERPSLLEANSSGGTHQSIPPKADRPGCLAHGSNGLPRLEPFEVEARQLLAGNNMLRNMHVCLGNELFGISSVFW